MQERRRPSVQGCAQKEEKLLIHLENHRGGEKITWNQNKLPDKFLQMEERNPRVAADCLKLKTPKIGMGGKSESCISLFYDGESDRNSSSPLK